MSTKKKNVPTDKPETKPVVRPPKKGERQLRVEFTEQELLAIAKNLAEANAELARSEDDKKAVVSQLKAKCDRIAARVGELSSKINSGFEYRNVQVETRFDDPKPCMKSTVRLDTGETIECEQMTIQELQGDLPLGSSIDIRVNSSGKIERAPSRTVSGDGVVVTDEDDGAFTDEDDHKL